MDMEISHESGSATQKEFVAFLDKFGGAMHAVNKTLQVITKYDFPKVSSELHNYVVWKQFIASFHLLATFFRRHHLCDDLC